MYKGKDDGRDYGDYRGISKLSVLGKIYGKVLISRVMESTKEQTREEQRGFKYDRRFIDHIFVLKLLVDMYGEKRKSYKVCREEM